MKVLIASDGSEFSKAAIDEFCRKIIRPGDEIRIVSAIEPFSHVVGAPFGVVDDYYRGLIKEARTQGGEVVGEAEAQVRGICSEINVSGNVLLGAPVAAILEEAADWGAEMIVLGTHGRGFLGRALLGSVSSGVLNQAKCPVLIVRRPERSMGIAE